jgi:CAAX protease family protein
LLHAVALVLVSLLAARVSFYALFVAAPGLAHTIARYRTLGPLSWWVIVPVLLVSPLFEETLYLGIAATVLSRRWRMLAVFLAVVAIRMVVHLYPGPLALVGVLPLALIFTWYYLRTGRLWPVVLAHVIIDAMACAAIAARP